MNKIKEAKKLCKIAHANAVYYFGKKEEPYYYHCYMVAKVIKHYCKENINFDYAITVAYLHDTIEDTPLTYIDIKKLFGKSVADGVLAVTKNEKIAKEQQMIDCIHRIVDLDKKEIAIVKMADRIVNLHDVPPSWDFEKEQAYLIEAKMIYNNLKSYSESISKKLESEIAHYSLKIKEENKNDIF